MKLSHHHVRTAVAVVVGLMSSYPATRCDVRNAAVSCSRRLRLFRHALGAALTAVVTSSPQPAKATQGRTFILDEVKVRAHPTRPHHLPAPPLCHKKA
ncbi:hypothetical protein J6590_017229 [Homalodisca vitripennis]|nr:hypothetical protein J6590_017229 [Homalodisca vitripennis]